MREGPRGSPANYKDDQISATPGLSDTVLAHPHISRSPQVFFCLFFLVFLNN